MYRLIFSVLFEIENSAVKPNARLYRMEEMDFREFIILLSQLGYIRGEIITFTEYNLTGAFLTNRGHEFLLEHDYLKSEYPAKSELPSWVREDSVYTRRI